MDAEHRHELKTNELADWIGHFPDFCRQNAKTIIGVALIIAAVGVYFYSRQSRAKARFEQEAQAVSLIEKLREAIVTGTDIRRNKGNRLSVAFAFEYLEAFVQTFGGSSGRGA